MNGVDSRSSLLIKLILLTTSQLDKGWLYVERCRDGVKGWIPNAITREIESEHVRARNFRQRYLFLKSLTAEPPSELHSLQKLHM